jgi:hypothetical protein
VDGRVYYHGEFFPRAAAALGRLAGVIIGLIDESSSSRLDMQELETKVRVNPNSEGL